MDTLLWIVDQTCREVRVHPVVMHEVMGWMVERMRFLSVMEQPNAIVFRGVPLIADPAVPKHQLWIEKTELSLVPDIDDIEWTPYDTLAL